MDIGEKGQGKENKERHVPTSSFVDELIRKKQEVAKRHF